MLPKTGKNLHQNKDESAFAAIMAEALTEGLGPTHQAVKIAMRWTGASERSVKHWLAGTHAPRAIHLLGLIRHSDEVLRRLLIASGRRDALIALEVSALRGCLIETLAFLDKLFPNAVRDGCAAPCWRAMSFSIDQSQGDDARHIPNEVETYDWALVDRLQL